GLIYKLSKKWMEAGDAYFQAANCFNKRNPIEAITLYIDSSNCYRDYSSNDAIYALHNAIELCKENGRFRTDKTPNNYSELEQYEKAIDIFLKVANISKKLNKSWYPTDNIFLNAGLCQLIQNLKKIYFPINLKIY
ncbi:hypothetical protein BCR36DRAFT_588627, partial [Piromyces finnis]